MLALALMLMGCYGAMAQITPSVYAGVGNYTNLGGAVGIGTEVRYKFFSANAAIGGRPYSIFKDYETVGDNPYLGFDVGLKCYFYKGLFGGVNYGVIGKYRKKESEEVFRIENCNGFSFTLGYKWNFYKSLYGMTYVGITTEKDANRFFNLVLPRFGFILGWDFLKKEK